MSEAFNIQQLIGRIVGIVTLKDSVYEEIEHDQSATTQAAIVVAVSGILAGIGLTGDAWYSFVVIPVALLIGWVVSAYFIFLVGTRAIPSPNTEADLGQVLRLTGFASVTAAAGVLAFIPVVGWIVGIIAWLLGVVLYFKAIMHALEMDVVRAISTAFGAMLLRWGVLAILMVVFGIGMAIF